jgi:hypothetical protein
MGLSNSIRELLLENIERNNYVNDLIPVSKQSEFSVVEKLHHKTIEASKKIKVSKKKSVKNELIVDKIEELSDDDDEDDDNEIISENIESIKESYSDLNTSILNDIEYDDENMETAIESSQDLSSEQIDEPVPLLDGLDTSKSKPDMVSKPESDMISKLDTSNSDTSTSKLEYNKEMTSKPESNKEIASKSNPMDTDFFTALSNIENKSSEVKQSHKSNIPQTTDLSGGANTKVIKLTEKYDFF